ncbi:hypothetical protein F1728_06625 [Gimesia benthica]|uniref:Uncharacterized protein n=1 Tax=Gimesia benthica TaxID=2608982 RepID=A0A6I6A7M5_9PLAN|nr:hypothetical protein [Gimesia benthica]QGQ22367.1 hypothetical protein F1728_06625 [Gimesia benthica]
MSRYSKWVKNDYEKLKALRATDLFQNHLLPDIKKGIVFPAVRGGKIDFYHLGRKLFSFDGKSFRSNIKYLVVLDQNRNGEVTEKGFQKLKLCQSFEDGYQQIKKNTKLYVDPESEQVSKVCKRHSYFLDSTGPIIVLDIELSLTAQEEDRTADRIDLILLNQESKQIRFFEVKTFKNKELKEANGHIPVVGQIGRYKEQLANEKRYKYLLESYLEYVEIINMLFGIKIPQPESIDRDVDLLIFDFGKPEQKILEENILPAFSDKFRVSVRGDAGGLSQGTLQKWWDE